MLSGSERAFHRSPADGAPERRRRAVWVVAMATLVASVWLTYFNARSGSFHFDDFGAIADNPSIRTLASAFAPPTAGSPVNGRPIANFTFALNYRWSGLKPEAYHLTNIALHAGTVLLLFGLVRRTLRSAAVSPVLRPAASILAWAIALSWAVHPLNTGAVTYVSQRTELLVGLCYVAVLYAFNRSCTGGVAALWQVVAVIFCWAGMASKEVMVSAPIVVLFYDRTFAAGTFAGALRRRRWFYAALGASWVVLGWLMVHSGGRGGTAGFGLSISPWQYACTQAAAIVHYLALALWPAPLVFDYGGTRLVTGLVAVWPQAVAVVAMLVGTVWALASRPAVGFLGAAFFAMLAPTTSFVPVADTVFEHRMYLPLAVVVAAVGVGAYCLLRQRAGFLLLVAGAFGLATVHRNGDYRTEISLWSDTVAKRPDNVRAHYTLGSAYAEVGQWDEAIAEYHRALALAPESAEGHNNLASALARLGRIEEAKAEAETALRITPSAEAHNNLANVLMKLHQPVRAREHYLAALALRPNLADAQNNLGNLLAESGAPADAIPHYEAALRLRPDLADAHANLANALAQTGRFEDAVAHYEAALQLNPDFADAQFNLATTLLRLRRARDAVKHYETVLRLRPDYPGAATALERARMAAEVFGR